MNIRQGTARVVTISLVAVGLSLLVALGFLYQAMRSAHEEGLLDRVTVLAKALEVRARAFSAQNELREPAVTDLTDLLTELELHGAGIRVELALLEDQNDVHLERVQSTGLGLRVPGEIVPLAEVTWPLGQALLGQSGIYHGVDEEGRGVVSAYRSLEGLPMGLVMTVSPSEFMAEFRNNAFLVVFAFFIVWFAAIYCTVGVSAGLEEQLDGSRDQMVQLVESGGSTVVIHRDFAPLLVSRSFRLMLGDESEDPAVAWNSVLQLVPPHYHQELRAAYERVRSGLEASSAVEHQLVNPSGGSIWCENQLRQVMWNGEAVVHSTIVDISHRKLQEEHTILNSLSVEHARDAIYWIDSEASFINANDAACSSLGYERDALLSMKVYEVDPKFDEPLWREHWLDLMERRSFIIESEHERADGSRFPVEISVNLVQFEGKYYNVAFARDITQRVVMNRMLRSSEDRFRTLIEASIQGVLIQREGRPVFVNQKFAEIFGYESPAEIYQLGSLDGFSSEADIDKMREFRQARLRGENVPNHYEIGGIRKDGTRIWLDNVVTVVDWEDSPAVLTTVVDITERKANEDQLRQLQKMEAVGHLTGGVAHDFNNLLTIVLGNLSLIEGRLAESFHQDDKIAQYLDAASSAATRGAELTNQLLSYSRKQVLQPQITDVNALVTDTIKLLNRTIGVDIKVDFASQIWKTLIDPTQLQNALINLALNSRDALPAGGTISFETMNVYLDEAFANQVVDLRPGKYVMIAVRDDGTGIQPDILDRIIEPFFTTKEVGKGSGLGLSMIYGFAKQSGGHLDISSREGVGTTVRIYLPHYQEADSDALVETAEELLSGSEERVLLLEDNSYVRLLVKQMLESLNYSVREAGNAPEALRLLSGESFELLLTDVVLPGDMNGIELARNARSLQPDIKVMYMSGYAENILEEHTLDDAGFLAKPFTKSKLSMNLRELLDKPEGV